MAELISFTKDNLDRLPIPDTGRSFFSDNKVPSLRIQVTATGAKSFQVVRRLGGKVKFITLGRYPDMTPEQARQKARITVSDVVQGVIRYRPNAIRRRRRSRWPNHSMNTSKPIPD